MVNLKSCLSPDGKCLDLRLMRLKALPSTITSFKAVEIIHCSSNRLTSVKELAEMPNLRIIDCSDNQITSLDDLKILTKLRKLRCSNNCLKNLPNFGKLEVLDCSHNYITQLPRLDTLRNLICADNPITFLDCIENLELLDISKTYIGSLKILEVCTRIRVLICEHILLPNLMGLENLLTLKELNCANNLLRSLQEISQLTNLTDLLCYSNYLHSITAIKNLTALENLKCFDNRITTLEGIENLRAIKFLACSVNKIHSLEGIQYLRNLETIYYLGNPIQDIPPHIVRFLHHLNDVNVGNFYYDNQNIHNSAITKSTWQSISKLMSEYHQEITSNLHSEILDSSLDPKLKSRIFEYFAIPDVHSELLLNFEEVFAVVWHYIHTQDLEIRTELYRRLTEEMTESECQCFTGRLTRLVNVLSGFCPVVKISISEREQCGNIMTNLMNQGLGGDNLRQAFEKECAERQIDSALVKEYIEAI